MIILSRLFINNLRLGLGPVQDPRSMTPHDLLSRGRRNCECKVTSFIWYLVFVCIHCTTVHHDFRYFFLVRPIPLRLKHTPQPRTMKSIVPVSSGKILPLESSSSPIDQRSGVVLFPSCHLLLPLQETSVFLTIFVPHS